MNSYLHSIQKLFAFYKKLGEDAINQLTGEQLLWKPGEESNSIANIIQHLSGNMMSRFTDFLTTDGEKPWRNRDAEFEDQIKSKDELLQQWEKGWSILFNTINNLKAGDLEKIIYIRNEGHTVLEALNRQLAHYAYHTGQMVFIAKHLAGSNWKTLSIAKGKSGEFNEKKFNSPPEKKHFV